MSTHSSSFAWIQQQFRSCISTLLVDSTAVVDDVVNDLLAVAAFASCCIFDAPFVHQMSASSMSSSGAVVVGPLASRKVKAERFACWTRDKILVSVTLVSTFLSR